ncbi:Protein of unknown function DUF1682 [Carpediemonas membranifera]|uniref:DUF1682-domain-containing protein n=1 Tax=Carpediemonas membranifera TaxID=201153 RepID=A0A8J6B5H7_9EUKA|nr:Protein of unknown function DUF1682 [Carpediemonas membranifera]|eukprot:KAG9393449.1 Protein of unknown function DUF1682 [Carpediemonas membranifera]
MMPIELLPIVQQSFAENWLFFALIAVCLGILAISMRGKRANTLRAREISGILQEPVSAAFDECDHKLYRVSNSSFTYRASGHAFAEGLVAHINLMPRHDLVTRLAMIPFTTVRDAVVFEIPLKCNSPSHTFAAISTKGLGATLDVASDLRKYCSIFPTPAALDDPEATHNTIKILSTSSDLKNQYLTPEVIEAIKSLGTSFHSVHITDKNTRSGNVAVLRVEVELPASGVTTIVRGGLLLSLALLNIVPAITISKKEMARRQKEAQKAKKQAQHEKLVERTQQKRQARDEAEEKKLVGLSGAEQRKLEEKKAKKEAKRSERRQSKRVM